MVVATQVQILSAATSNIFKYLPVMALWNPQRFPTRITTLCLQYQVQFTSIVKLWPNTMQYYSA